MTRLEPVVAELVQLRESVGMSKAVLAQRAGISPATVSLIERGLNRGNLSTISAMARVLGCRVGLERVP
ncbi:MAG TPA: helix-turn-helix transcriptional regulator [Micromonosporaceae bacterium]